MPRLFLLWTTFMLLAFFGAVLWGTEQFAFRDGAHFYHPLYRYIQEELAAGRLPLWMPYENLGQPLAGNPAAGLFYPGKLLFFLPCDFVTLYHWFIVLHVFCAAATMYRLVRFYGKSEAASTFAAIVYAFGGSVVYQHLNVIFLIGAAWFPELIRLTLRQKQARRFSCGPPIVIALMVLGGDVQAAYHAGLVVLFLLGPKKSFGPLLLAFLLAAVQILPAWEFSRASNRTQTGIPRSLWEVPSAKDKDAVFDGLLCRNFDQKGHARTAYNFSVAPWRLAEMVWPNIGGKQFPQHSRWFSANSYDKFVWVPSLYCGIIALIFAVVGSFQQRFLALVFTILVVASFGSFGIGWLLHRPDLVGDPVGGIYWLMNLLLPGYVQFRYPAKLLTVAAIPFAILAAYGFDQVVTGVKSLRVRAKLFAKRECLQKMGRRYSRCVRPGRAVHHSPGQRPGYRTIIATGRPVKGKGRKRRSFPCPYRAAKLERLRNPGRRRVRLALGYYALPFQGEFNFRIPFQKFCAYSVLFVSLVMLVMVSCTPLWNQITGSVPNCPMFGPFQADLAKSVVIHSLLHTIVVLAILAVLERGRLALLGARASRPHVGWYASRPHAGVTPALQIFLIVLCCLDLCIANRWMIPTADRRYFAQQSTLREKITETHQGPQPPRVYRYSIWYPSLFRNQTSADRFAESVVFDRETLWPKYSLEHRVSSVAVQGTMSIQSYENKLREIRSSARGFEHHVAQLGIEYVILPTRLSLNPREAVKLYSDPANDVALWKIKQPGPIAWLSGDSGPAKIVSYEPNRIVLETDTTEPQTLVLAEQHWPGWKARITGEKGDYVTKIFPVDEIFRGIEVPSGKCRITFDYDPFLLKLGAIGTLLGVIFVTTRRFAKSPVCFCGGSQRSPR